MNKPLIYLLAALLALGSSSQCNAQSFHTAKKSVLENRLSVQNTPYEDYANKSSKRQAHQVEDSRYVHAANYLSGLPNAQSISIEDFVKQNAGKVIVLPELVTPDQVDVSPSEIVNYDWSKLISRISDTYNVVLVSPKLTEEDSTVVNGYLNGNCSLEELSSLSIEDSDLSAFIAARSQVGKGKKVFVTGIGSSFSGKEESAYDLDHQEAQSLAKTLDLNKGATVLYLGRNINDFGQKGGNTPNDCGFLSLLDKSLANNYSIVVPRSNSPTEYSIRHSSTHNSIDAVFDGSSFILPSSATVNNTHAK